MPGQTSLLGSRTLENDWTSVINVQQPRRRWHEPEITPNPRRLDDKRATDVNPEPWSKMEYMTEVGYSGTRFSSVLTARWAVFFDILGIEYLYEPQRLRVGNTIHSPSFFLPSLGDDHQTLTPEGFFIDVQFSPPTEAELQTALAISRNTKRNVCIFYGAGMTVGLEWWPTVLEAPRPCFFSQCPFCGRYGIGSTSLEDREPEGRAGVFSHGLHGRV